MDGVSQWHREPVSGTVPGTRIGHSSVYYADGSKRLLVVCVACTVLACAALPRRHPCLGPGSEARTARPSSATSTF